MKTIICLIIAVLLSQSAIAQSIVIGSGSSIEVGLGADICAGAVGNITGHLFGDGTECGNVIPKTLNLIALIEGFYNGTSMVPDTVTVEFRNTVSPYSLIEQKKILLDSSGAGTGKFTIVLNSSSYYLVVKHRNALQTWSSTSQTFSSGVLNYNFTTNASQAYGNNQVLVGTKYCIFSGDVSNGTTAGVQDGFIDIFDDYEVYNDSYTGAYRLLTDLNLDGFVDIFDDLYVYNNSYNGVAAVYPGFPRPGYLKKDETNNIKVNREVE